MRKDLNIAIYTADFAWAGGIDFLFGLVKGLLAQTERKCKVFVLIHDPEIPLIKSRKRRLLDTISSAGKMIKAPGQIFRSGNDGSVKRTPAQQNVINQLLELFTKEKVEIRYYNDDCYWGKLKLLNEISADVILPVLNNKFAYNYPVPWVGYMFDYVYRYYPGLYTKDFCLETDIKYASTLLYSKSSIVNSKATYDDVYKFYPYAKSEVFALPFAPFTNESIYNAAVANTDVCGKYKTGESFFIISNQFWLHKGHETAFHALAELNNLTGTKKTKLVCTGLMTDLSGNNIRQETLLSLVKELGLEDQILFLGHISKIDQLALMIRCKSVIQPTQFEGGPGGGSVYMAIANNAPSIVSDIPVNREIIDEPLVSFFTNKDPKDLAAKMIAALGNSPEHVDYAKLESWNKAGLEKLGNTLIAAIDVAIGAKEKN